MQVSIEPGMSSITPSGPPKEMLSVTGSPGNWRVRINFSSLSIMQECWRKTDLALNRGLRSTLESPATLFGSAIHKALETFYSGDKSDRVIPPKFDSIMEMIGAGHWEQGFTDSLLFRAARDFVVKAEPLAALSPENKRSINNGVYILTHYFQKYIDDPFVILHDMQGAMVERKFTMPLIQEPGLHIEGFGTIDAVFRNEQTGVILVADHKTTSMLGNHFYQRLKPNFQYTFYTMAAQRVFDLDTDSFLVNALQVKDRPKTARGAPPQFARQVTTRNEEDFEELRAAIVLNVETYLSLRARNMWPMTSPGPCSNYAGCQYQEICSAPKTLHETIIAARYKGA